MCGDQCASTLYMFSYFYNDASILFQTIEALSSVPSPELALRLYLECAEVCNIYENAWCAGIAVWVMHVLIASSCKP